MGAKGLALLHKLVPSTPTIGLLGNPNNSMIRIQKLEAATDRELDAAFESLVQAQTGALLVGSDIFLNSRIEQLVALAAHHAIPVMYSSSEFVVAGGLISYGVSLTEAYRQVGLYAGRILKGEKPADLPVIQGSKFDLVINLKTARALGLAIPAELLAIADRVIE